MSKPIKQLIRQELTGRLEGVTSVAVVELTGVDAISNNKLRGRLREQDISLMVVKNSLGKQALREVGMEAAADLLAGPCALAFGSDSIVSVVRELRDIAKEVKAMKLKGALLDGDVFGADRMEELASFPTRDEAISQVLSAVLSAGGNLVNCITAPGANIASLLKKLEEDGGGPAAAAALAAEEAPAVEEASAEEAPAEEPVAEETPAEDAPADDAEKAE
jgi:large subunit ribosomal protein L10